MPLMGSLYIGASGLQTSQNSLNTTAHNMSNVDTQGYTRQQVQLGSRVYNTISRSASAVSYQQYGLGVVYSQVKQVRDSFLDKTYRRESGRSAFYDTSTAAMEEVEDLLGELEGENFSEALTNLWTAVQELAKDPSNSTNQGLLMQRSYEFLERSQAVYNGLGDYQDNMNLTISNQVDTLNKYGERMVELNNRIIFIEANGMEKANDLRDERNKLLDDIASMVNMTYSEDAEGNVNVKVEGVDFVKEGTINRINLSSDPSTGFYTPYWSQLADYTKDENGTVIIDTTGAEVFNLKARISSDMNTDIGGLKATLLARGDHRATYKDIQNEAVYDRDISQSIMMNVQGEFDQLVYNVVNSINQVLKDAADAAGAYPGSTYMRDENGNAYEIFNLVSVDPEIGYTCSNLIVNDLLRQEPSRLSFIKADDSVDYDTATAMKEAFTAEKYTLNPNVATKTNLVSYYSSLVSQVANSGSVYKTISENQATTVSATLAAREQIVGVSTDEELSNMIMYQNAFNASSRYINVVSQMLEHLINTLGA